MTADSTRVRSFGGTQDASLFPPPGEWTGNSVSELEAAGAISLLTDRRVERHELPDGDADRRGWWGDTYEPEPFGSRIWLARRSKVVSSESDVSGPGVLSEKQIARFAEEALQWLIDDGVVTSLEIETEARRNGVIIQVTYVRERTAESLTVRYDLLWEALRSA